jgi:hypothetical protein
MKTFELVLQIASLIILAATGWIVWLYTRAAQRSNEIQEEPILNLRFHETTIHAGGSREGNIFIKNIGKGPAYDIRFEKIELPEGNNIYSYRFHLDNPMLEPLQEIQLDMAVRISTGGTEQSSMSRFLFRLVPPTLRADTIERARKNPAIFLVHYKGVNGKIYYSVFSFYSTLPPVGDMVIQFIARGVGRFSSERAKSKALDTERIESPVV